jgi:DNA-binding LacI/PurR family transcriptional regulator/signal transduction histidine kinase
MNKRKKIVYLTDNISAVADLSSETERMLWEGVHKSCINRDCDLLVVIGRSCNSLFNSRVYDLIDGKTADGFVSWITGYVFPDDRYFNRFNDSKMVCVTMGYGDHPEIQIPVREGMESLMHHLIDFHKYTKFVFMSGPHWHPYVQNRLSVWRQMLREKGLECGEDRVSPAGPWDRDTGRKGAAAIIDERGFVPGKDIEVMVCASDRIALGVLDECKRRGIRVPEDVVVTGYDNIQEAQSVRPSLTTVSQPFDIQTKIAIDTLLAMIEGKDLPDKEEMKCNLVIGESCGCFVDRFSMFYRVADVNKLIEEDIYAQLRLLRSPLPYIIAKQVAECFNDFCNNYDEDLFFSKFKLNIEIRPLNNMDLLHWQDIITVLRMYADRKILIEQRVKVFRAIHRLRVIVDDMFVRSQTSARLDEFRIMTSLRKFSSQLTFCGDYSSIWNNLHNVLREIGIPGAWVSLFVPDEFYRNGGVSEQSKLSFAYLNGEIVQLPKEGIIFCSRDILPLDFWDNSERKTHLIQPLDYGGKSIGFAVFRMEPSDGTVYEALAMSLSSALAGVDLNKELYYRSKIIENSIVELRAAQAKLIETEKLAALGALVAGVAHEMNTPIGISLTSVSYVLDIIKDLESAISRNDNVAADFYIKKIQEGSDLIFESMKRSTDLIDQFKQLSIDEPLKSIVEFKCEVIFAQIKDNMKKRFQESNVTLQIECDNDIALLGHPVDFFNIIKNLALNSLSHGFENRESGSIRIRCYYENEDVIVQYSDDGKGMSPEILARIFEPFFTTSHGKGCTGLGMHIVYNTLCKQFGGMIVSESSPGQGVTFTLRFPPIQI